MKTPQWFLKKNIITWLLWPVSVLYLLSHGAVYLCRLFRQKSSKRPVICVGGLLSGGVGKTPVTGAIARHLSAPIIMRGYNRKGRDSFLHITKKTDVKYAGDEAKMLSNYGLDIYVGNRQKIALKLGESQTNCSPMIMDDGFQNPLIKKDISILVFDAKIGVGNGFVLPAGPLREPLHLGLSRADAILIIDNRPAESKSYNWLPCTKKPVFFAKTSQKAGNIKGQVIAFAGIGYPEKFFDSVKRLDKVDLVKKVSFADHHFYTNEDMEKLFRLAKKHNAKLITTEKDWVKIPPHLQDKIDFVPLEITIDKNFWNWLDKKLEQQNENIH